MKVSKKVSPALYYSRDKEDGFRGFQAINTFLSSSEQYNSLTVERIDWLKSQFRSFPQLLF